MRDKDVLTAAYLKNNSRFADLLNGWLFGGRPVVRPEDIQELDSAEIRIRRDRTTGGVRTGKRYRDVIRRVALGMRFAVICVEEQSEVDYTMPFRVIGYDLDRYEQQLRIRRQEHRQRKDLKAEEYLSGISREDRFLPVVTLVLYFGKHWDGPRNLKDLLDLEGMLPEVRELLADYPVHVIEVGNYPYAEAFRTDLKLVFGFVQNADDKEKLQAFARAEEEALSELAEDAYDLISVMTGTEELDRIKKEKQERKGKVNMCKAIDDMLADAREEGRERGRSEMMNGLQEMIADAREEGREAGRSETMNGLQEMIADAREEGREAGRSETMNGLQEMIADAREEGREAGRSETMNGLQEMIADAREEGREAGRSEMMNGLQEMIADAREEGREAGRSETMNGLQEMITDVREEERKETIQTFVNDYIEEGFSREILIKKLQKMFSLDQKTALEYVK